MNQQRKEVIEKILAAIQQGDIVDGNKLLPERRLAEIIGETRPILREGLIALDALGVVDIRDRQGIFLCSREESAAKTMLQKVHGWPADLLSRAMEIRQILEPIASGIAAKRRSQDDLQKMRDCLEKMEEFAKETTDEAAEKGSYWNTVFHTIIFKATGNAYLSRIYESVDAVIEEGMYIMRIHTPAEAEGGRLAAYRDHLNIYKAIEAKNIQEANSSAAKHVLHTVNALVQIGRMVPASNLFVQQLIDFRK